MENIKIVWLKNKEGGQKIGNIQIIRRSEKKDFDKIKPLLQKKYQNYEVYKKEFPKAYISFIKKGGSKKWKISGIRGTKEELMPQQHQEQYAKIVKTFGSKEAVRWRETADSERTRKVDFGF